MVCLFWVQTNKFLFEEASAFFSFVSGAFGHSTSCGYEYKDLLLIRLQTKCLTSQTDITKHKFVHCSQIIDILLRSCFGATVDQIHAIGRHSRVKSVRIHKTVHFLCKHKLSVANAKNVTFAIQRDNRECQAAVLRVSSSLKQRSRAGVVCGV